MPRALRGRFEIVDHFVLGHLSILGPLPALGSPHAAKRFIGLAIVVRGKDRVALASSSFGAQLYLCPHVAAYPPGRVPSRRAFYAHAYVVQKIALTDIVDQVDNSN